MKEREKGETFMGGKMFLPTAIRERTDESERERVRLLCLKVNDRREVGKVLTRCFYMPGIFCSDIVKLRR